MDNNFSEDIPCEKCPLQFGNRIVLNMHLKLVHKIKVKPENSQKIVKIGNECRTNTSIEKATDVDYIRKSSSNNKK